MGLILLQVAQVALLSFASSWRFVFTRGDWGRLMFAYANTIDKLDVIRGRTVPSPPFKVSYFLNCEETSDICAYFLFRTRRGTRRGCWSR